MVLIFIWIISDYRVGDCLTDQMSISAPGSTGSPVICGYNSGQHSNFKLFLYPIHNYIYNNCIFQWFWTLLVLIVKVSILTLVAVHLPLDNGTFLSHNTLAVKRIWEVLPDAYNTILEPQGLLKSKLTKMNFFWTILSIFPVQFWLPICQHCLIYCSHHYSFAKSELPSLCSKKFRHVLHLLGSLAHFYYCRGHDFLIWFE